MLDRDKQLKFQAGSKTEVTVLSMGMEEVDFGSKYVVHIKETIDGVEYDHFLPSDGLKGKIMEANISEGDIIVIEKVAPSEKYIHGYFNVEMAQNQPVTASEETKAVEDPVIAESPVGTGFAQKDDKAIAMDFHELSIRVEALEKEMLKLKKDAVPF